MSAGQAGLGVGTELPRREAPASLHSPVLPREVSWAVLPGGCPQPDRKERAPASSGEAVC